MNVSSEGRPGELVGEASFGGVAGGVGGAGIGMVVEQAMTEVARSAR
jgi:hypothetical protein